MRCSSLLRVLAQWRDTYTDGMSPKVRVEYPLHADAWHYGDRHRPPQEEPCNWRQSLSESRPLQDRPQAPDSSTEIPLDAPDRIAPVLGQVQPGVSRSAGISLKYHSPAYLSIQHAGPGVRDQRQH